MGKALFGGHSPKIVRPESKATSKIRAERFQTEIDDLEKAKTELADKLKKP
jgi:hypothetical protein